MKKGIGQTKAISNGNHKNIALDKFIQNLGIEVMYKNTHSPYIRRDIIFLPPKENFEETSNYYHALNHEVMHFISKQLDQDSDFKKALRVYTSVIGKKT